MSNWHTVAERECGYLEVFTTQFTGTVFGYRIVGSKLGPQVVVAGSCDASTAVFERLLAIPTLPWLRGNLVLILLDALDDIVHDISSIESIGHVDRTIMLANSPTDDGGKALNQKNYHMILRVCAELGMISGRGVASAPRFATRT